MKPIAWIFAIVFGLAVMSGRTPADDRPSVDFSKPVSPSLGAGRTAVEAKDLKEAIVKYKARRG